MIGDYEVRVSPRARRLRLQLDVSGQLLVVVPKGFDQTLVPRYLEQHRDWIERVRAKAKHQQHKNPELFDRQPPTITLAALKQSWPVRYGVAQRNLWREVNGELLLRKGDEAQVRRALIDWLNQQAKSYLPQRLELVSQQTGLSYARVAIRAQKTRWGSCSAKQNINLNRNLLFLPQAWVDYLCLHELCHTKIMNHSPKYWALVASFEAEYQQLEKRLTKAIHQVPLWARP